MPGHRNGGTTQQTQADQPGKAESLKKDERL